MEVLVRSKTFSGLGIPFPLFQAVSDDAREYCGLGTCSLCGREQQHSFRLGIGCAIMSECPGCGVINGLDADDRKDCKCRQCKKTIPFPKLGDGEVNVCYSCLRAGRAAITKDTELGMISWEQAFEGVTHGIPGLNRSDFELVPREDDWVGVRLPQETMFELLQTPRYKTIQGDCWQFCCGQPMVFAGEWSREEFSLRAPDKNGKAFFEKIVQDCMPGLWEDQLHDITGVYVFQCSTCSRLTAHWDIA